MVNNDQGLRQLVSGMQHLPSMPQLYIRIVEELQDPEISLDVIGEIIAKDLGMTAKILNLVNSSFFGAAREVSSPEEAVIQLGAETIKSLVLSIHAFSHFKTDMVGGISVAALWQHSQRAARLAQALVRMEVGEQKMADEAFVGGLLHDIGKLVLASNFPAEYSRIAQIGKSGSVPLVAAEENTFGANHAEVGGYLMGLWGLPVPVVEAIALHHAPIQCTNIGFSALTAVHAANELVNFEAPLHRVFDIKKLEAGYQKLLRSEGRLGGWRATDGSSLHD
jgi:putative nucleotidyltransferase with HDIG domain